MFKTTVFWTGINFSSNCTVFQCMGIGLIGCIDYNVPMYLDHFGLIEAPFSIAPDPRYLYMSERHREALAHLLYGMASDGAFILLTGDVGTGKTTVSRCLLEQVPDDTNMALVLNPKLNAIELLQVICDELRIDYTENDLNAKSLVDYINQYLLSAHAQGRKTVVLIEEAQNLDLDVLEQLRLLTNLETSERKLLQVILLGQPELIEVLDRPELSQLSQRITARFHLTPLALKEVEEYIGHRLAIAGCRRPLFAHGVIKQLYKFSGGVPRLINVLCDRALLGCYVQNRYQIDKKTLNNAAREVLGENKVTSIKTKRRGSIFPFKFALLAVVVTLLGAVGFYGGLKLTHERAGFEVANQQKEAQTQVKNSDSADAPVEVLVAQTQNISTLNEPEVYIKWPENNSRLRSNLQAYEALFERWQLAYNKTTDSTPCYYAQTQGLACLHEVSDVAGLRKLNRPAVLKLYDDFNQAQYITLISLGARTAQVIIAYEQQNISLRQLEFYWKGEYSMLWRFPPGYKEFITPGYAGESVVWLSQVMNEIDSSSANGVTSYYDPELVNRVKQFQLSQGLESDGVVGVKTLIHINQVRGTQAPELENGS